MINLGGLERVNLSGRGAAGGGRRPQHRFLSRVWVSLRVLVEREGQGGCCSCISYHGREGVYIYIDRPLCRSYLEGVISSSPLLFLLLPRERKIIKEKEEKRKRKKEEEEEKKEEKKKVIEEKKKK